MAPDGSDGISPDRITETGGWCAPLYGMLAYPAFGISRGGVRWPVRSWFTIERTRGDQSRRWATWRHDEYAGEPGHFPTVEAVPIWTFWLFRSAVRAVRKMTADYSR